MTHVVVAAPARRYLGRMIPQPAGTPACDAVTRLALLSKVGELAGILDYDEVLAAIARLSIPEFADFCIVDVVHEGQVWRAHVAHRNPAMADVMEEVRRLPASPGYRSPSARDALLSRRPLLVPEYTEETAREHCWSASYVAAARELGVRSFLVVPLLVRGSVVALSTFVMTSESGRRYQEEDLALAEELARRAAAVVENARLYEELKRSEQRFRVALAHTHVAVFEKDRDLRIRWVYNPMFGLEPGDMIGRPRPDTISPDDVASMETMQRSVLQTGEPAREEQRIRIRGEAHHLLAHMEPLRDPSGEIVGLTGAYADVTEQKRVQEALAEALVFRERMLGVLGHDLRNPLSAMATLASMLLRRNDLAEDAREQVAEIDRAGKRMLEMIGTLLDFSQARFKGTLPIAPVPMDLHQLAWAIVEELQAAHPGRKIDVALRGNGWGRWDPARMAQVVSNLVGNAITHGAPGEPVRVVVGDDDGEVRLVVRNGGRPIPPELLPVLFEPFRRGADTGNASHARGLGLGLYIAKQIVTAHGGEIEVHSTIEDGTTFAVRVPRGIAFTEQRHGEATWQDGAA
jgi:PAS domain S-box-containing protein